jgi:hypothetical protein
MGLKQKSNFHRREMNNPNKKAGESTRKMAEKRRKIFFNINLHCFNFCGYFIFNILREGFETYKGGLSGE